MGKNILPIILIVLAVGVYFTYTAGQMDEIKKVQLDSEGYQIALKNAKNLIAAREKVQKARKEISDEDIERLNKIIPDNIDNIRLIIDVNGIASRHGVTLRGVRTSAGDAPKAGTPAVSSGSKILSANMTPVTISFGVATTYENFISFMQDIERSLRIMDISKISLTSNDDGVYNYNVEIKTYWLKQ